MLCTRYTIHDVLFRASCHICRKPVDLLDTQIVLRPRDLSFLWVKERIIPSGRQNISAILKNHKMDAYDEMKFLELSSTPVTDWISSKSIFFTVPSAKKQRTLCSDSFIAG